MIFCPPAIIVVSVCIPDCDISLITSDISCLCCRIWRNSGFCPKIIRYFKFPNKNVSMTIIAIQAISTFYILSLDLFELHQCIPLWSETRVVFSQTSWNVHSLTLNSRTTYHIMFFFVPCYIKIIVSTTKYIWGCIWLKFYQHTEYQWAYQISHERENKMNKVCFFFDLIVEQTCFHESVNITVPLKPVLLSWKIHKILSRSFCVPENVCPTHH